MSTQLPLALRWPRRQRFEHFHAGENAAAVDAVRAAAVDAAAPWVFMAGPLGSGRTHLLIAACQAAIDVGRTAQYLPLAGLRGSRADAIRGMAGSDVLAIDDIDSVAGEADAEHALFDTFNRYRAEGATLLFSASGAPVSLDIALPDLRSRLGSLTQALLKPLGDMERRVVLREQAGARGIELDDVVLDWLFAHHARDLGTLLDLLDTLDRASLAAQRRVTVPFLRNLLKND
ncbi:MAG: DnaA regulatory inactivator Hda [Luteibacter sp.]|uniref:DnaA regulatory inactivator Hda n=1 Tax=unclassified Luteibacter TaxID=2620188 RepID=UPI0005B91889|nr:MULTISPECIES: DnaA regulatory inactivator Hda [unclassified Luteibacter]MDQ7997597.1 DnaA regulatory inactivator Hda [Luteibacter sp.]MDQ8047880.1 DnaA regulatory inactivator Hda [Luteibacter sp.]MDR6642614.1 DnaA family protein [Luteibacter sp. 1214]